MCTCVYACSNERFKANDIQKLHLWLARDGTPSVTLTTEARPLIHYNLKTSPTYSNYFKMHSKIPFFIEMRCGRYNSVVKKVEGVLWLQSAHYTYGICQTVEEKLSPTLPEPEICFWRDGQEHGQGSHYRDLIAKTQSLLEIIKGEDGGLFCLLSNLEHCCFFKAFQFPRRVSWQKQVCTPQGTPQRGNPPEAFQRECSLLLLPALPRSLTSQEEERRSYRRADCLALKGDFQCGNVLHSLTLLVAKWRGIYK